MKKIVLTLSLVAMASFTQAQNLVTENFDVFPPAWTKVNASVPAGVNQWNQATASQTTFYGGGTGAYNGAASTSYAFANFNSTTGNNTISNWLITPVISLMDGDVISFYSSKGLSGGTSVYADNLQLRISPNGATTVNPVGPTDVGDFTILALDINPTLSTTLYPNGWTLYSYTVTGLPVATSCKVAFRYFVTNGGPAGANSDQVAIDQYAIDRPVASASDFFTINFAMHPNPVKDVLNITAKNGASIESVQVVDINGRTVNQTIVGNATVQINVSNLNSGVYFVKVQSELGVGTSKIIKN
jgi:hypothetical protein